MTTQPPTVSVTTPIGQAIDQVRRVLFQPFDLGKWFVIGFCAWLAHLGDQGFNGSFNFGSGRGGRGGTRQTLERTKDYVLDNLDWILPLVAVLVVLGLALWLVFTWVNSRGKFMFLHCVALNKAEVQVPWQKHARAGNSLFLFRVVLGLIGGVLMLPLVVGIILLILGMVRRGAPSAEGLVLSLGLFGVLLAVGIVFALVEKCTKDFVVPIMFLRGVGWRKGWGEFWRLLSANVGHFILYILFQIVLALVIGTGVLIIILATCCIAGCLLVIPYLGTVLLLPVLVFSRAYSLYYLAQFGGDYDVFAPAAAGT